MTYYRAYRPQRFSDLKGQPSAATTLQQALLQQRLSHAYLFSGPRGTGKTSTARILARACGNKGYKGRLGIFEVLNVTEEIRDLILKRSSNTVITEEAVKDGMVTMVQDGILKALDGLTTIEEVWRVTKE